MRKKLIATVAVAAVVFAGLAGCAGNNTQGGSSPTASGKFDIPQGSTIGVALPDKTSENWVLAEGAFKKSIEAAGYKADIQYANASNTVPDQQAQINSMVTKGDKVIIIGAKDGSQLGAQVKAAKDKGILVIAWDRNLTNTKDYDYFVAFNNFTVGEMQAKALLEGLQAKKASGPYNIELFAGSLDDSNAKIFFDGAMSVLQPKIDDGTLVVQSGQTEIDKAATQGWLAEKAQARMSNILTSTYTSKTLDGVLSPNDTLARAIIQANKAAGKPIPVVTGQDSEKASIPLIMDGTQYHTIYKDTDKEAQAAIDLVVSIASGKTPDTVIDENNNNGVFTVPAVELTPVSVTKANAVEAYANNPTLEALAKG